MILVKILPVVSKDDVGLIRSLNPLKFSLYGLSLIGEEAFTKPLYIYFLSFCCTQKATGAFDRFFFPIGGRAENDPPNLCLPNGSKNAEDCPTTSNFNIISMSAQTENLEFQRRPFPHYALHCRSPYCQQICSYTSSLITRTCGFMHPCSTLAKEGCHCLKADPNAACP